MKVQPNAKRSGIVGVLSDRIRIALRAPAVDGKANKALVEFLADWAGISKSAVQIVRGEKSREKTVLFAGLDADQLRERLSQLGLDD